MREIELTQGKTALVDDEDYEKINQWNWVCNNDGSKTSQRFYAIRRNGIKFGGKGELVSMHREIMGFPIGMDIDHIDGNTLNNQKKNLRICTRAENLRNRKGSVLRKLLLEQNRTN